MKKFLLVLVILLMFGLTSCGYEYSGEHSDLYTVAINSLLWNCGHSSQADWFCDPDITIIEEDDYGRRMFEYTERWYGPDVAVAGLIIMQASDIEYVYYYEDVNFISQNYIFGDLIEFPEEKIETLKEKNDWNRPYDIQKCVKKSIVINKWENSLYTDKIEEVFENHKKDYQESYFRRVDVLTEDDYGRAIYYGYYDVYVNDSEKQDVYLVILINPDLTYAVYTPTSMHEYQEEFKEFKATNNWNCEFD